MSKKKTRSLRCPTCRTLVLPGNDNFPFCSERCKLIDLGKWASGAYVISIPATDPEKLENAQQEKPGKSNDADSHR